MKILHLSPLDPIPVYSGLRERIYQTSKYLGSNHEVHLVYPYEPSRANSETGRIPPEQPFESIQLKHPALNWLDQRVPHYSPLRGLYKTHPWLYPSLRNHIAKFEPDVILVEMPFLMPIALAACHSCEIPIILTEHNIQFKVTERLSIPGTKPLKVFESFVANQADAVATVSETDQQILSENVSSTNLVVAPNGVDTDQYHPNKAKTDLKEEYGLKSPIFIYHGSLGNAQNSEALEVLIDQIFPLLRNEFPDAHLLLIGANPPEVDQPGVVATGIVDNLPEHIAIADVATVPLLSGSGTKLKILEYMASGVPVVTTSIGAEGLPLEDGKHAAIEDDWDAFVQQVTNIVRDEEKSLSMSCEGRKLVEEKFSWQATLEKYNEIIESLE
ncbi:MAG: glycosyltransferase family 4 protein [Halobacteriaceae archaeon]